MCSFTQIGKALDNSDVCDIPDWTFGYCGAWNVSSLEQDTKMRGRISSRKTAAKMTNGGT
jgi:hypothetical protein